MSVRNTKSGWFMHAKGRNGQGPKYRAISNDYHASYIGRRPVVPIGLKHTRLGGYIWVD